MRGLPLALVAAAFATAPVRAHHSFAVHFVADRLITVQGTVDEFTFRNPHGVLMLTAKGDDGAEQQWTIETNSPNILRRRGWTETSIKPHPPATAPHSRVGHSIGRREGDTLIVDTTHLLSGTFMNNGFNHSEGLHMTERFRLSADGNVLSLVQMYEDSAVFEGVAALHGVQAQARRVRLPI